MIDRDKLIRRIITVEASRADYVGFMEKATEKDFDRLPFTREQMIAAVSAQTSHLLVMRKRERITDRELLTARVDINLVEVDR